MSSILHIRDEKEVFWSLLDIYVQQSFGENVSLLINNDIFINI